MVNLLGWMVVLLLVGPPLVILAGVALTLVAAVLPDTRRVRETFRCPWTDRLVRVDFLVREGAPHPSEVACCTAFRDPTRVSCKKACRGIADVRWGLSRGLFPRWALTAGGPVAWTGATRVAAAP